MASKLEKYLPQIIEGRLALKTWDAIKDELHAQGVKTTRQNIWTFFRTRESRQVKISKEVRPFTVKEMKERKISEVSAITKTKVRSRVEPLMHVVEEMRRKHCSWKEIKEELKVKYGVIASLGGIYRISIDYFNEHKRLDLVQKGRKKNNKP